MPAKIVFYAILTNLSIIASTLAIVNISEPITSRMLPNYNIPPPPPPPSLPFSTLPLSSPSFASSPPIKFPLPNPYSLRLMHGKPMDPFMFAPPLFNGIVPMALSFSVGYFLLRLLTLGLFFVEKELAFPYGHYRLDQRILMDAPWDRSDPTTGTSTTSTAATMLEHKFHQSMDKYSNKYD